MHIGVPAADLDDIYGQDRNSMTHATSLESYNSARFSLKNWLPMDEETVTLKEQLLDFLDIAEKEKDRLLERCRSSSVEQQQIEMALCHTEDAISITSANGDIRLVNPAFERLTGCSGAEVIGASLYRFWEDADLAVLNDMKTVTTSGRDWTGELVLKSKSGDLYDVQTSVVPIILYSGAVTHLVFTIHNITERIRLENNLKRQKQFLERVINLNPSIIIILDEDGNWMLDNLAAKTLISDMGNGAREKLSKMLTENMKTHEPQKTDKLEVALPDESRLTFMQFSEEIPAKYLVPESGEQNVYLITLSNITEIERKNHEILVRQKALLASRIEKSMIQGEAIKGFVYHLQKPINITKAAISTMQTAVRQNATRKIEQALPLVDVELAYLEKELHKFRDMYQQYPANKETTLSDELSEATSILYREQIRSSRITIGSPAGDAVEYPLAYEIMQLLLKILIDNSLESAGSDDSNAQVNIRFNRENNGSTLTVEDNGPGIPKKERYKVFEPFFTTKQNRSGLSLTILHQIINNIRGTADLSASDLGGAKMTLFFPATGP